MVICYINVLKQIAEVETKGNISFNDISRRLKMSTLQLKGLLEIMERMGLIERVTEVNCNMSPSSSDSCKNCGSGCSGKVTVSSGTIYRLTEKGRRICNNQTD